MVLFVHLSCELGFCLSFGKDQGCEILWKGEGDAVWTAPKKEVGEGKKISKSSADKLHSTRFDG